MNENLPYPKGDIRRLLCVLAAVDALGDRATMISVSKLTGLHKRSVTNLLDDTAIQLGVQVEKVGPTYAIKDWGPVIKRAGAKLALNGLL